MTGRAAANCFRGWPGDWRYQPLDRGALPDGALRCWLGALFAGAL